MSYQTVIVEKTEKIAVITLNRPERLNATNRLMNRELLSALDDVEKDDDIRVLIITGAGRGFSSGADVDEMADREERGAATAGDAGVTLPRFAQPTGEVVMKLQKMLKPSIAMVNGMAVGGGFTLALACDIRVGSENARFMNAFVKRGLTPGGISAWLYPRVMGLGKTLEYLLTGDFIEAKEAERLGILNRLVPAEKLKEETMSLARKIATGPSLAIGLTKQQVYEALGKDLEGARQIAAVHLSTTAGTEDHREGVRAFQEKRQARFRGK